METVEVVIKISKKDYEYVKEIVQKEEYPLSKFYYNIANGTPLPEGHGDLIDRDRLINRGLGLFMSNDDTAIKGIQYITKGMIKVAPTVIEADKSESENNDGN